MPRHIMRILTIAVPCLALVYSIFVVRPLVPTLAASPSIMLSVSSGPPTTKVRVSGAGFGSSEKVTIDFDMTSVGKTLTDSTGAFALTIQVPSAAAPGTHAVQAIGQTSGLSAQNTFLVQTDWPSFGFNAQLTHDNPYENVLNFSTVPHLTLDWADSIIYMNSISTSPIVANGVVYVIPISGSLDFVDAYTGKNLGNIDTPPDGSSTPAVANGMIYVGASWSLYAFGLTKSVHWTVPTGGQVYSSPTVANGVVYFGSSDDKLYAVNASTGTTLWTFTTGGAINSTSAVKNGIVYVSSGDGNLYALKAATGKVLWKASIGVYTSSPAIANGVVYVGTYNGLYALNASTGATLWNAAIGDIHLSTPAVANGVVYVGLPIDALFAINAATGSTLWITYTNGGAPMNTAPTVANGVIYVGSSDHNLYAFDASTGATLWSYTMGNGVYSPIVANGIVYATSGDGYLYAFHLPAVSAKMKA